MEKHEAPLTSAEMAGLWGQYMNDSAFRSVLTYFLAYIEDDDTRKILHNCLELTEKNLSFLTTLFEGERFPIPVGFSEDDVNQKAPRLFSDLYALYYVKELTNVQMTANTLAIGLSTRSDIVDFHDIILEATVQLHEMVKEALLAKGVYIRPPYIPMPESVEFVTNQHFLGTVMGQQRPLTTVEISHLFLNTESNAVGKELTLAFAQVTKDKKVAQYLTRGKETYNKHIKQLRKVLVDDDLPAMMPWDAAITDSKISPFSDKLMMFLVTGMSAAGIAKYSTAMGASPRKDISLKYARLLAEVTLYVEDGLNLMIDNGWLEELPQAPEHNISAEE